MSTKTNKTIIEDLNIKIRVKDSVIETLTKELEETKLELSIYRKRIEDMYNRKCAWEGCDSYDYNLHECNECGNECCTKCVYISNCAMCNNL